MPPSWERVKMNDNSRTCLMMAWIRIVRMVVGICSSGVYL